MLTKGGDVLDRVLEPEVMNTSDEAHDYNQMDHSRVNRLFVDDFLTALDWIGQPTSGVWQIFDAGTGTALIPIELIQRGLRATVIASDLADEMLIVARQNVTTKGLDHSIKLVHSDCKRLPDADETYDAVMSNSIVHHIPEPYRVLRELWRILRRGGLLFIRDLARPDDDETLERLVETYAEYASTHQKQMFRDSLHAALTVAEVCMIVRDLGVTNDVVQLTSDRHWTICCQKKS
jgi:ubiquinone/menaquinone biosynthesis C-methylase UbiE